MNPAPPPFIRLDDRDGRPIAVRRQAIIAMIEEPAGTTAILVSGGRVILIDADLETALTRCS